MKRLWYKIYIRYLALRFVFKMNLGDEVWHKGRKRTIINWAGCPSMTLSDPYQQYVPLGECKKVMTPANLWHSYSSKVKFYTQSWLDIWVNNGIEPWIKGCRIWPWSR
jgi:hypothetical protein